MKKISWFDKRLWSHTALKNFHLWFWKLNVVVLVLASNVYASDDSIVIQGGWLHTANSNYGDGINENKYNSRRE